MFTLNELIDYGVEFDIELHCCYPVSVSIKRDAKILKHEDWKKIKTWLQSNDFQRYIFPKLFQQISSRPKKGQLTIFDAYGTEC